jgi:hypothetical protein
VGAAPIVSGNSGGQLGFLGIVMRGLEIGV